MICHCVWSAMEVHVVGQKHSRRKECLCSRESMTTCISNRDVRPVYVTIVLVIHIRNMRKASHQWRGGSLEEANSAQAIGQDTTGCLYLSSRRQTGRRGRNQCDVNIADIPRDHNGPKCSFICPLSCVFKVPTS